jgi:hypothetical protein
VCLAGTPTCAEAEHLDGGAESRMHEDGKFLDGGGSPCAGGGAECKKCLNGPGRTRFVNEPLGSLDGGGWRDGLGLMNRSANAAGVRVLVAVIGRAIADESRRVGDVARRLLRFVPVLMQPAGDKCAEVDQEGNQGKCRLTRRSHHLTLRERNPLKSRYFRPYYNI